jgi:hypothetical protein
MAAMVDTLRCADLVMLLVPGELERPPRQVAAALARAASDSGPARPQRSDEWFDQHLTARATARAQCAFFDSVLAGVKP